MINYINIIKINKLLHLNDFNIPIGDSNFPHLFITGKNGSGKTILLDAIADFLDKVRTDERLSFMHYKRYVDTSRKSMEICSAENKIKCVKTLANSEKRYSQMYGRVDIGFANLKETANELHQNNFIVAFYSANRRVQMYEPRNPEKPSISKNKGVRQSSTIEFLKFLVDLKVQAALAQNEKMFEDAKKINDWFAEFQKLLRTLYDDKNLTLGFDYKNYSFMIFTADKEFRFNQLSDGYAAIIDIVADLILRMQSEGSITRAYEKKGIVLIDEIETHLHLDLQKNIMPILTKVFPNIQFIVTTHSPFVLSSLPNAIAFDLENRKPITELSEYSYEALAEGYFGVSSESSYIYAQLEELKRILEKDDLNAADKIIIKERIEDFKDVTEITSPAVKGEFQQLMITYANRINEFI